MTSLTDVDSYENMTQGNKKELWSLLNFPLALLLGALWALCKWAHVSMWPEEGTRINSRDKIAVRMDIFHKLPLKRGSPKWWGVEDWLGALFGLRCNTIYTELMDKIN